MDVIGEALLADVQDLVGAEGRGDDDLDGRVFLDLLVPLEGVDGSSVVPTMATLL
mgnify:CR=1 FL=1